PGCGRRGFVSAASAARNTVPVRDEAVTGADDTSGTRCAECGARGPGQRLWVIWGWNPCGAHRRVSPARSPHSDPCHRARALDKAVGSVDHAWRPVVTIDAVGQQLQNRHGQGGLVRVDRGEGRPGQRGLEGVVVTDHRDLIGDQGAQFLQTLQRPARQIIVAADDSIDLRCVAHEGLDARATALLVPPEHRLDGRSDAASFLKGLVIAAQPQPTGGMLLLRLRELESAQIGWPATAQTQQMRSGLVRVTLVISAYIVAPGRQVRLLQVLPDEYRRLD